MQSKPTNHDESGISQYEKPLNHALSVIRFHGRKARAHERMAAQHLDHHEKAAKLPISLFHKAMASHHNRQAKQHHATVSELHQILKSIKH